MTRGNWNSSSDYAMDVLGIMSFVLGLLNYGENLDQTKAQDLLDYALDEIHGHLQEQDKKIDLILDKIGKEV